MWIKICGNTRLDDCRQAAELGADAVGFVFAPGRRTVTAAQVAAITSHLPSTLEKIGVFTAREPDEITSAVGAAGLTGVQLHGAYDPALAQAVHDRLADRPMFRLLQVLHWDADRSAAEQIGAFTAACLAVQGNGIANAILIDSRTRQGSGGTGVTFDWVGARAALAGLHIPVIVAGGLRPENVADAVSVLQPYGVDVSSGVERAPGWKDAAKQHDFVNALKSGTGSSATAA